MAVKVEAQRLVAELLYLSTQVKLADEFSAPGLPVNFGHFGHLHSGRERPAFGP